MSQTLGVKGAIVDGQYVAGDVVVDGAAVVEVGQPAGSRDIAILDDDLQVTRTAINGIWTESEGNA